MDQLDDQSSLLWFERLSQRPTLLPPSFGALLRWSVEAPQVVLAVITGQPRLQKLWLDGDDGERALGLMTPSAKLALLQQRAVGARGECVFSQGGGLGWSDASLSLVFETIGLAGLQLGERSVGFLAVPECRQADSERVSSAASLLSSWLALAVAEQELRVGVDLAQLTLSSISDAVFITNDDGRFTFICPNVPILFGRSAAEVAALGTVERLMGPLSLDLEPLERQGELVNQPWTIHRPDGEPREVLVNLKRVSINEGTILYSCRDVTERNRAEAVARRTQRNLNALVNATHKALEVERQRLSREIHDELGQQLTGLLMDLAWLSRRCGSDEAVAAQLADSTTQVEHLIETVRRIATDLRPAVLDHLGLIDALEWMGRKIEHRCEFSLALELPRSSPAVTPATSIAVFRAYQEALTNIQRHAEASHVEVQLRLRGRRLQLVIRDDGAGFDLEEAMERGALGLLGMRQRLESIGGALELSSQPGRGTVVTITAPVSSDEPAASDSG